MGRSLTKNEKAILYGLTRYPRLNNRELAEHLEINESTMSTVKKRLEQRNLISTIRVPNLQALGCEILVTVFGKIIPVRDATERVNRIRRALLDVDEIIYGKSDSNYLFFLLFAKNYTDACRALSALTRIYSSEGLIDSTDLKTTFFPLELSRFTRFFDYSTLLQSEFGLRDEISLEQDSLFTEAPVDLSETEAEVLYGLVKHPVETDSTIARRMDIRRQTFSRIRRDLEEKGIINTVRIPNIRLLGYEVKALTHIRFKPSSTMTNRREIAGDAISQINPLIIVSTDCEMVTLTAHKNFHAIRNDKKELLDEYVGRDLLLHVPEPQLFATRDSAMIRNHDYTPITAKILGVKKDGPRS